MRVILCMAALLTLTACGTAEQTTQVASLQTSGSSPTSSAAPQDERPRERIDATPEEKKRISEPYAKCMTENGIPVGGPRKEGHLSSEEYKRVWPKAWEKCEKFFPLPAWEFDKNNPESMDYIHRVVECLRKAGASVEERPAGPGEQQNSFEYTGDNLGLSTVDGMALTERCQKESLRK